MAISNRTSLIEEEQELSPAGSSPPTAVVLSNDCQPSKEPLIPLEIILSPINQKKAFHFDHLLTIAQLTSHLLNDWPADWAQPGSTVPHHANQFRMVYMGRFLDEQETLNSLGKNRPIIIHLVIKPDESAAEEEEVDEEKTRLCGCFGGLRARSPGACSIV
ncbi:hypothetical protein PtB15_13B55 [Puccinia triticina]|nr:hypothetical protein PtB15_13B55 [Puccinia triticina]